MIITADFLIEFFKAYWWVFLSWQLRDSPQHAACLSQDGIVIPMDKILATAKTERVAMLYQPENKSHGGNSNLLQHKYGSSCDPTLGYKPRNLIGSLRLTHTLSNHSLSPAEFVKSLINAHKLNSGVIKKSPTSSF